MPVLQRARNALTHARRLGLRGTARYAAERLPEVYNEWRLGISTIGNLAPADLGISNPFSASYYPSDYPSIFRAIRRLPILPFTDGFLDYGCGMGRVLVVASTFPFRKVIGIELSPILSGIAKDNVRRAQRKLKCHDVEVLTMDAARYRVPTEVNFIFFYNPFSGPVLSSALGSIHESLMQAPRKLWVVFKNTIYLDPALKDHPWLIKRDEFPACDANHTIMLLEGQV